MGLKGDKGEKGDPGKDAQASIQALTNIDIENLLKDE